MSRYLKYDAVDGRSYQTRKVIAFARGVDIKTLDGEFHHINLLPDDLRLENIHEFKSRKKHCEAHKTLKRMVIGLIDLDIITFDRLLENYTLNPLQMERIGRILLNQSGIKSLRKLDNLKKMQD